jgi:hypothetical protein
MTGLDFFLPIASCNSILIACVRLGLPGCCIRHIINAQVQRPDLRSPRWPSIRFFVFRIPLYSRYRFGVDLNLAFKASGG